MIWRKLLKKILSFSISMSLVFSTVVVSADTGSDNLIRNSFRYAPHSYEDGDLTDTLGYAYTDDYFKTSACEYNPHLSTMSMVLASASISSQDADADYEVKSRNITNLLTEIGFCDVEVNEQYKQKPGTNTMGVATGHKQIGNDTLLVIVPRSAGYEKEWSGNFNVGEIGQFHKGFELAKDQIMEFAQNYVAEHKDEFTGDLKVWIMGYSCGAATANITGGWLVDNPDDLGVSVKKENLYVYTFGTPNGVWFDSEQTKEHYKKDYENIHNLCADYDPVTMLACEQWGFTKYGEVRNYVSSEKKSQMLEFLKVTNETVYNIYTDSTSGADADNFAAKKIDTGSGGLKIVDDTEVSTTQAQFLKERIDYLTSHVIKNRTEYVGSDVLDYEHMLESLLELYNGMTDEQASQFFGAVGERINAVGAVAFSYYIGESCLNHQMSDEEVQKAAAVILGILQKQSEDGSLEENSMSDEQQGIDEDGSMSDEQQANDEDGSISDEQQENDEDDNLLDTSLNAVIMKLQEIADGTIKASDSETFQGVCSFIIDVMKEIGGEELQEAFAEGIEKAGIEGDIASTVQDISVTEPLVVFVSQLLFGNDNSIDLSRLINSDWNVTEIKTAATFLGNSGSYMRVHNNEVILSWLRTQDTYFNGEQEVSQSTDKGAQTVTDQNSASENIFKAPQTGDSSNIVLLLLVMTIALGIVTVSVSGVRRRNN